MSYFVDDYAHCRKYLGEYVDFLQLRDPSFKAYERPGMYFEVTASGGIDVSSLGALTQDTGLYDLTLMRRGSRDFSSSRTPVATVLLHGVEGSMVYHPTSAKVHLVPGFYDLIVAPRGDTRIQEATGSTSFLCVRVWLIR